MFTNLLGGAMAGGSGGGGPFGMSSSSSAGGDDGGRFGDFNYRTSSSDSSKDLVMIGAVVLIAIFAMKKK